MKTRIARWSGGSRRKPRSRRSRSSSDDRLVRSGRSVDREDADVRVPGARAARLRVARVDEEALEPGVEAVRIAETGQLTPGDHQRLLHGILGPSDVPEDPLGDRHQPVTMRPGQDGECLPVPALGLLDEVAIQPIVLRGAHQGRLPTLLSRARCPAFNLRVGTFRATIAADGCASRPDRGRRVRRAQRGPRAGARPAGDRHPRRPPQLPPVPAAAVPGRDRRHLARRHRPAAALDPASPAEHDRPARRGGRDRPGAARGPALGRRPDRLRHADRRHRRPPLLLRPRRMGAERPGPQVDRRRARDPPADPHRLRGGRARAEPRAARRVDDVRGRRRRPDRRRAGGRAGRDLQRHAAARLPIDPLARTPGSSSSRRSTGSCRPTRPTARRRRPASSSSSGWRCGRRPGSSTSTTAACASSPRRGEEEIPTRTTLWAAGVQASSFVRAVAAATGAETDRAGRIIVGPDLTVPGHPEILALGDAAVQPWRKGRPVPGVAQGAIQAGGYAGRRHPGPPRREAGHAVRIPRQGRRRGHRAAAGRDQHRLARPVRPPGRLRWPGSCGSGSTSST